MLCCSLYLPPISFFSEALKSKVVVIDVHEHFVKQSMRNQCLIYSSNGPLKLSVFLQNCRKNHVKFKDILISYEQPWNKIHWKAILSAYSKSPFFLYYCDYFEPFYNKQFKWLYDFNTLLLQTCFDLLKANCKIEFTDTYVALSKTEGDYRNKDGWQVKNHEREIKPYTQVFQTKYGFISDLSIIDLLFCAGPSADRYL